MKNIYIYFGWFSSSWNDKKNDVKKKKKAETRWTTAHLSHDIMDCIVTQGWGGWPGRKGLGHDTARRPVIRLRQWPTIRSACARGVR